MTKSFRVGVVIPQLEIEHDAIAIKDFGQALEGLGYDYIAASDHIVGADSTKRPGWQGLYDHTSSFHEPLVLFSYLAGVTRTLKFTAAVIVLPQRQTVLVAKQAANLDIFSQGRLDLGVGVGWNAVEFEALGVPFSRRGARIEDQIQLLRRLWTAPTLSADTPYHKITDAGLNPLPIQRPIPIWLGGAVDAAVDRAARISDGWICFALSDQAAEVTAGFRDRVKKAGRDPKAVKIENVSMVGSTMGAKPRSLEQAAMDAELWRKAGADGVMFDTMRMGLKGGKGHIDVLRKIAENLKLKG